MVSAAALRRLGLAAAAAAIAAAAYGVPAWLAAPAAPSALRQERLAALQGQGPRRSTSPLLGAPPARHPAPAVVRRAKIDGDFGVMPELPAPVIDTSDEEDPIWERLVVAVQAADNKRSVDITAFWAHNGFEIIVLVTALSRPQLQAIAAEIQREMKSKLRMRRARSNGRHRPRGTGGDSIRAEASMGWCILQYPRLTIHVMMPVQRSYYDLEGLWRDEWEDYEEIDLQEILREESFGNMRLKKELDDTKESVPIGQVPSGYADDDVDGPYEEGYYEPEEDDPFWS